MIETSPLALLALLATPSPTAEPIGLVTDGCEALPLDTVMQILSIETGRQVRATSTAAGLDIELLCDNGRVRIRTGDATRVEIEVQRVAKKALARLLALSLAEVVSISPPPPEPAPPPPEPDALTRAGVQLARPRSPPPAPEPTAWELGAKLVSRGLSRPWRPTAGAGVEVRHVFHPNWAWSLDILGEYGRNLRRAGRVHTALLSAAGLAWWRHRTGAFALSAGLGGRLGWAWLLGSDAPRAGTVSGPWAGPAAGGRVQVLDGELRFEAGLELGVVTWRIQGELPAGDSVWIDGVWGALSIGVGSEIF